MADTPVFVYVASYDSVADAQLDYEAVKQLHLAGIIGTYDAAVISKDAKGKVHVSKHEKPTQHGGWTGLAAGAVVGLFFPPFLVWDALIGAGAGALIGHIWRGLPRDDMKQIGDLLDNSTAALVVLGKSHLQQTLQKAVTHATRQYEREIAADSKAFNKDYDAAVNDLIKN